MKKIIIIIAGLFSFAHAQDSTQVREKRKPIKEFKIWVNGQLLDADNLDVICVEDDFDSFANFRYNLSDSTGKSLVSGFIKMEGQAYRQYLSQPNHGDRATAWVMQQLNLQQRAQKQAVQAQKQQAQAVSTKTPAKQ